MLDVESRIEIGMRVVATDHAAQRLLVGSVGSVWIMTHAALLRGVGALDFDGGYASFSGIPGDLSGDVGKIRCTHVSIHGTRLVFHSRNRQMLIGNLRALVFSKALVDRPVDFLAHMANKPLPTPGAGGGKLLDALLLQALAQLGLAPPLLPVALLSLPELTVKGAVVLAVAGGQEVGNPNIHANHRS